jgi:chaperone modulatory protein CbpM
MKDQTLIFEPELLEQDSYFTLDECSQTTQSPQSFIIELITEDIIQPKQQGQSYLFSITHVQQIKRARSFSVDLGVNLQGIALALELLDRIEYLERG